MGINPPSDPSTVVCYDAHTFQGNAINDMEGVNDIAQGFAHLAAMRVTHHGMQVHLQGGVADLLSTPPYCDGDCCLARLLIVTETDRGTGEMWQIYIYRAIQIQTRSAQALNRWRVLHASQL